MDEDYRSRPLSREEICALAWKLREALGATTIKALPVVKILEYGMHRLFPCFNYCIVPVEEMPGREAVTYPAANEIDIRQDTYEAACRGNPHACFTLAHELGHLVLHTPETITLAYEAVNAEPPRPYESPEWQADAFAGDFLAPPRMLHGLSVDEIAEQFNISRKAAKIQFDHLPHRNWFGPLRPQQLKLPGFERF